jgi:ABC-2 type transport system permease protein
MSQMAAAVPPPSPAPLAVRLWRGFAASTQLGWTISSNWTRPFIFLIYTVLRPVSGALILVVMYRFITGNRPATAIYLAFLVTGIAFWSLVQNGLAGLANGISEDRGFYRMLKYVYLAPQPFPLYLVGRGLAQMGVGLVSAIVVLVLATVALGLPISLLRINYLLLLVSCVLATAAVIAIALAYGLLLLGARDSHGYGEIAAQVLYIVSGAIFPIAILPGPLATIAAFSPLVYWLELVRRSLLGSHSLLMFPHLGTPAVLGRLLLATAGTVLLAGLVFSWAERTARRRGLIDMETSW